MTLKNTEKNYDAWLSWMPTNRCNLKCVYCESYPERQSPRINHQSLLKALLCKLGEEVARLKGMSTSEAIRIFKSKVKAKISRSPKIRISALIRTLEKTGKVFLIGLGASGEPFLIPNIIEACVEITRRHYLFLTTNLTSKRIKEFCDKISPERVVRFGASAHIKELERCNLMDRYIDNFRLCKEAGFEIFSAEVAYPPLLPEVEKYKDFFKKRGIELCFSPYVGCYNGKKYPGSYSVHEINSFGLDKLHITSRFRGKGKICNAGYNVGAVLMDGTILPCFQIDTNIGNIYEKIIFRKKMITCPYEFCTCPVDIMFPELFVRAVEENKLTERPL